jgi:capsular exopolysaccharide synthesis family protein
MVLNVFGRKAEPAGNQTPVADGAFDLEFDGDSRRHASLRAAEGPDERLVSLLDPSSVEAEQYRMLRHRVEQRHRDVGLRILAVTSPAGGEGKTTTAINLAGSLAQSPETRVLLVDADLRRPALVRKLGWTKSPTPGLSEAIRHATASLKDIVRIRQRFNLHFVPAGALTAPPYEILKSARLGQLLDEARHNYDYVIVDTPPVVPCPDYGLVEKWVDAGLLVVSAHRTTRRLVDQALQAVDTAKLLGLVFNGDDTVTGSYHYGGYSLTRANAPAQARGNGRG